MTLDQIQLKDLQLLIADRIFIKVAGWNLYLGDAGLAEALALECNANLDQGAPLAARKALESVQVPLGGGQLKLPLARLISAGQLFELEDILDKYSF